MRVFRTLVTTFTAVLLAVALLAVTPAATATAAPTTGRSVAPTATADLPKRSIELKTRRLDWRTIRLKGTVQDLVKGKVRLQKKKCGKCKWKTVRKVRTNKKSKFKTKIYAPRKGRWFWRVRVPASDGYARSTSRKLGTWLN